MQAKISSRKFIGLAASARACRRIVFDDCQRRIGLTGNNNHIDRFGRRDYRAMHRSSGAKRTRPGWVGKLVLRSA
jgi:hypothetical protein